MNVLQDDRVHVSLRTYKTTWYVVLIWPVRYCIMSSFCQCIKADFCYRLAHDCVLGLCNVLLQGAYFAWKATAMGKNYINGKTFLEKR